MSSHRSGTFRRPGPTPLPFLALAVLGLLACQSVYYDVMEGFGRQKRHILTDRIEASRDEQKAAQEQFQTTLERFRAAADFDGGDLEDLYDELSDELEASEARAEAVRARIRSIEDVAEDLFEEWEDEAGQISSADLRRRSEARLRETRARYAALLAAMKRAEARMDPVLVAFRDRVLFLKHNLNARAVASLEDDVVSIESDVTRLLADMDASIREAEAFLAAMDA